MAKIIQIPAQLRDLQKPFFQKPVDPKVEFLVRYAAFLRDGQKGLAYYSLGDSRYQPFKVDEQTAERFRRIREEMFFPDGGPKEAKERSGSRLGQFLAERGVSMEELVRRHPEIYESTQEVLALLPRLHFGHPHFTRLLLARVFGGNTMGALWSEYSDPIVNMYGCAVLGPKRSYFALLLHEIGHSFVHLLEPRDLREMESLFKSVAGLFTVDYLEGEKSRMESIRKSPSEFIAENYMHYVTQSDRFAAFLETVTSEQRQALARVWSIFNKYFDGNIYV